MKSHLCATEALVLKRWSYSICLYTKLDIPVRTSLSIFNLRGLSILRVTKRFTQCKSLPIAVLMCWVFFNWINILHSRTDCFPRGLAVAIWEQIQFRSADEESNICSWFPAASLLQTMHLDAQSEFLLKKQKIKDVTPPSRQWLHCDNSGLS